MKKTKLTRSLMAACSIVALSAVMYGCVHSGDDPVVEPPPIDMDALDLAKELALNAANAAMTASNDAAQAVMDVADDRNHDAVAYLKAESAAADAMAAYMAAKAASDAAQRASTVADAEMYRDTAQAEQAKAEAAQTSAEMYADQVAQAKTDADAEAARLAAEAEAEATALAAARTAADMAADQAEMAASSAAAAVADAAGGEDDDPTSYASAQMAAEAAMEAATAAREASDAANRATTSADAEMYQMTAETQQGMAADSLADAMMYAGMVTQAKADADEAKRIADALKMAKDAAQDAEDAAMTASNAAETAVSDVEDSGVLATSVKAAAAFARAEDARDDAAMALVDAIAANQKAQAATSQEDAEKYRDMAVAAQGRAETALADANRFAGIVAETQQMADDDRQQEEDEIQRMMDVADARSAAMTSYMDADADAVKAEGQADAADATAPGTAGATAARQAADAARDWANAAKMAHDDITDEMTKAEADAKAKDAADAAGHANDWYAEAMAQNEAIQTAALIGEQQQEARDLAQAQSDAEDLYDDPADGILFHYDAVVEKARLAMEQADAARASAEKAMDARTMYMSTYNPDGSIRKKGANDLADDAKAASDEAQDSLTRAMTAKGEADTARQAAMDATTSADAKQALADLQAANAKLTEEHTGMTGAGMDYMAARDAAKAAEEAADVHVLHFFTMANAHGVTPEAGRPPHVRAISAEITLQAGDVGDGTDLAPNADGDAATTVTVTWPNADPGEDNVHGSDDADPANDPDNSADDGEDGSGKVGITVNIGGNTAEAVVLTRDNMDTALVNETNFNMGPGLPGFMHEFDIANQTHATPGDSSTAVQTKRRVLVFTDKKQDKAARDEQTITYRGYDAVASRITMIGTGSTTNGVTTYEDIEYDHDGDDGDETDTITGDLVCDDSDTACSITISDGEVTAISGYKFNGDDNEVIVEAKTATEQAADNTDFLAFGVWLREDATATVMADRYTFGAFAAGGELATSVPASLTGKATYKGSAAGVRATASRIDFFSADATLTADFGSISTDPERIANEDSSAGIITGMIHNIVANGEDVDDDIYLGLTADQDATMAPNVAATGTIGGRAWMGEGTPNADNDGLPDYPFNGTWAGNFYDPAVDDPDTEDVTEGPANTHPGAVAGTFGVTRPDNPDTMGVNELTSFVGAFGARKDD